MKKNIENKMESNIMTTEKVEEIIKKENHAIPLKLHERLWFRGKDNFGVRKAGIKFAMTQSELEEYVRCKLSVYYFAENYCKIKLEDGTVDKMTLRDYQKDIIKLYTENRYSILMASRQIGKCLTFNTLVNIKDLNDYIFQIPIGLIYYSNLKKYRELTFLENIKLLLYKLLSKI